jgi:hypothetical protein
MYGDAYVSGSLSAARYYGDGGLLSNISSSGFTQPLPNLVVSNSVTTSNIYVANTFQVDNTFFANTTTVDMNFNTLSITYINTSNIVVSNLIASTGNINMYGNVYVSNAVTVPNIHVTDTLDVLGSMTANAANATFFFDTFTIPYINTQYLNVSSNTTLTGNLVVATANIATLNVGYLTVNSAVVYGASTLNVYGTSNLSTAVIVGKQGVTTLNVTGNAYISNAVTTTNVFAAMANISTTNTQVLSVTTNMTFTGPLATLSNLTVPGNANIEYLSVSNLSVTGNLYVTATNVQTTNALTINNSGTMTALKVVQYEPTIHTHNVAEFWDATRLAMVIDPDGNVAIHTVSSPGYALTVTDPVNFETLYIRGKSDQTTLDVTGNLYVSNALTTTNVFATRYYGDAGFMSNISSSSIVQPFANLVVSNALTTTNVFVSNGLDVGPGTLGSNVVVFSNVSGGANTFVMDSNARVSIGAGAFGGGSLLSFGRPFANKILTLYDVGAGDNPSTATNFYGFGIGTNLLRYQVASAASHGFYGASSEYARITSTGVSILTGANPTSNLQVSGNAYISNALTTTNVFTTNVTVTTITGSTANTVTIASNVTTFQSNGAATVMTLTNGRVGIGTTNPQVLLAAAGTCTLGPGASTTTAAYHTGMVNILGGGTRALLRIENNGSVGSPGIIFGEGGGFTEDTQPTVKKVQGTNNLAIMCGGNVGIGTTSPGYMLDVGSSVSIPGTGGETVRSKGPLVIGNGTNDSFRFISALDSSMTAAVSRYIVFGKANSTRNQAELIYTHDTDGSSSNKFSLGLYGTQCITMLGSGNVGIGAVSPGYKLDVAGDIYSSGRILINNTTATSTSAKVSINGDTGTNGAIQIVATNTGDRNVDAIGCRAAVDSNFIINCTNTSGSYRGGIQGVNSTTVFYATSSDARMKSNVVDMPSIIDRIKQLRPCNFLWKESGDKGDGFIAQEVFAVFPQMRNGVTGYCNVCSHTYNELYDGNLCSCCDFENPIDKDGNPRYYGLDYGRFTPYLTKALQETLEIIETQSARITAVETENAQLKARLESLETRFTAAGF